MNEQFWIQIAIYILTGLLAVARVSFIVGRMEASMVTRQELKDKIKERDDKIQNVSEWINRDFVRKDMCGQLHATTKSDYDRIDKQFADFRHDIRGELSKLQFKVDELLERLPKKM